MDSAALLNAVIVTSMSVNLVILVIIFSMEDAQHVTSPALIVIRMFVHVQVDSTLACQNAINVIHHVLLAQMEAAVTPVQVEIFLFQDFAVLSIALLATSMNALVVQMDTT
jgi:hypothetical protein